MNLVRRSSQIAKPVPDRLRPAAAVGPHFARHGIVGRSQRLDEVVRRIELVAATRSTVLITGETGTGKELVARAVHECSARGDMPFVKVNCAAIPDALLESELFGHVRGRVHRRDRVTQGQVLAGATAERFCSTRSARWASACRPSCCESSRSASSSRSAPSAPNASTYASIAATNRDLRRLATSGRFLDDLYYRLQVVPIEVPPLRAKHG